MPNEHVEFNKWFKEQFGKRPKGDREELKKQRRDALLTIFEIDKKLAQLDRYDVEYRAVYYTKFYMESRAKEKQKRKGH